MKTLLTNQTTNGSGSPVDAKDGGYRIVRFYGTFDGCSVTVEADFGDGNFVAAQDTPKTEAGLIYLQLAQGMRVRATVSNAGASTDISVDMA